MRRQKVSWVVSVFLLPQILTAQSVPDFVTVSGFQLACIKSGQYAFAVNPQFQYGPESDSVWNAAGGNRAVHVTAHAAQHRLQFAGSVLYALDDRTASSLTVAFQPKQSIGSSQYQATSAGWPYFGSYTYSPPKNGSRATTLEKTGFDIQYIMTHRPEPNLELSLGGFYTAVSQPRVYSQGERALRVIPHFDNQDFFPHPYDVYDYFYPSYPDLGGFGYTSVSSTEKQIFGIKAGTTFISDNDVGISYVRPFGFSLAPLRAGRVVMSLILHYNRQAAGNERNDYIIDGRSPFVHFPYLTGYDMTDVTYSLYGGEGSFVWGLSDRSTASIRSTIVPSQTSTDQNFMSHFIYSSISLHNRVGRTKGNITSANLAADFVNRPKDGLELSTGVRYSTFGLLEDGRFVVSYTDWTGTPDEYLTRSDRRQRAFGIHIGASGYSNGETDGAPVQLPGCQLPELREARFAFSAGAAFLMEWSKDSHYEADEQWTQSSRSTVLRFESSLLYGISEELTVALSMGYRPPIAPGDRSFSYIHQYASTIPDQRAIESHLTEEIMLDLAFAYRPFPWVELSFRSTYTDIRRHLEGSTVGRYLTPSPYYQTSSTRWREVDIHAGIAIMKY